MSEQKTARARRSQETTIYLVRHTDVHNPGDVLYGRLPRFGLSGLGREQAKRTARVLADEPLTAVYSSPLLRARQTAAIIAERHPGLRVRYSTLLNEVLTGWQGTPHLQLATFGYDLYTDRPNLEDESLEQIWGRLERFIHRALRAHVGERVVAVTHGDLFALARAVYQDLPVDITSIRLPHPYPGKGALLRLTFRTHSPGALEAMHYFDPNGDDPEWNCGWVRLI